MARWWNIDDNLIRDIQIGYIFIFGICIRLVKIYIIYIIYININNLFIFILLTKPINMHNYREQNNEGIKWIEKIKMNYGNVMIKRIQKKKEKLHDINNNFTKRRKNWYLHQNIYIYRNVTIKITHFRELYILI